MKKPHWIETENHEDLIEPLTDLMIALSEGYHGEVMKANLIFDIGESKEIVNEKEKVAIQLFHDEGYYIKLYDDNPDKEQLLKSIEQKMNEGFGRKFKIFFDRNDTFSIKTEDIMGSETVVAHLGGGNIYFDIPQGPEVTKLIGEFYKLILEEENQ